jgi:hypothetical protein
MKLYSFLGKVFSLFLSVIVAACSALEKILTFKGSEEINK